MRDYQGRIYEDDCICPDCIHCDPVADECRKGRWRYPTDGCFDFVSRDGKETGLGEMLKRIADNFFTAMAAWIKEEEK